MTKNRFAIIFLLSFSTLLISILTIKYNFPKDNSYNEIMCYADSADYTTEYTLKIYDSFGQINNDINNLSAEEVYTIISSPQTNSLVKHLPYTDDFDYDLYSSFNSTLYSKYNCVIDANTNQIIYGNNIFNKVPNASTTKILTCIIALENSTPDTIVKVSKYAASMPDVQLNMNEGDSFYMGDLLYSLMLESHNDTAVAIAEHIGGTVEGFSEIMNEKLAQIGCKNSHFITPNGLDSDLHYTCAYDLCLIASYALKNEEFKKIINTSSKTISDITGKHVYTLNNHNAFLNMYPGAIGVKTGYTSKAGYCFCGAVQQNENLYISSVLACGWPPNKKYKWNDTKKLIDYAFEKTIRYVSLSEDFIKNELEKETNSVQLEYDYSVKKYTISSKSNIKYYILLEKNTNNNIEKYSGAILIMDDETPIDIIPINSKTIIHYYTYKDYLKAAINKYFG